MQSKFEKVTNRQGIPRAATAILCVLLSWTLSAEDLYTAGTAPRVNITVPANNTRVWLAGSDHTVTCTASDCDVLIATKAGVDDSVTIWWTGSGTFKDNNCIGASVTYICTNSASNNTITAHADDDSAGAPAGAAANAALFDEAEVTASRTVRVIVPVLNTVNYAATGNYRITDVTVPEYNRAPARNAPGAFKAATARTAQSTHWFSTALTDASTVRVKGVTSIISMDDWADDATGTFRTWPSAAFSHTGGPSACTDLKKSTYDTYWKYKVPSGSDTWIDTTTQSGNIAYIIKDTPVYRERKLCFEYSSTYCTGKTNAATDGDICDAVMTGFAGNYVYSGGNCHRMSSDYTHLIGAQGVSATQEKWAIGPTPYTNGQVTMEVSNSIPTLGRPAQVYRWVFHWWVTAGGQTRDPSAGTSNAYAWGAHEDAVFDKYERRNIAAGAWNNPAGQTSELGAVWKMRHTNPAVNSATFIGPPTP